MLELKFMEFKCNVQEGSKVSFLSYSAFPFPTHSTN